MSKTEVTVKQYRACVNRGRCTPSEAVWAEIYPGDDDDLPVTLLNWQEANQFADYLAHAYPLKPSGNMPRADKVKYRPIPGAMSHLSVLGM